MNLSRMYQLLPSEVVTLETGATINAPLFVEAGETIRINTETGEYKERVGSK